MYYDDKLLYRFLILVPKHISHYCVHVSINNHIIYLVCTVPKILLVLHKSKLVNFFVSEQKI